MRSIDPDLIRRAADAIAVADALVIAAGAGMGVDSGLPDFRGTEGFWRAYPPFARLGLRFEQVASPRWFRDDPALAWGFYGHRGNLYRLTRPHDGFAILRRWAAMSPSGGFVVTSNVDNHFTRAKFHDDRLYEVHGSIELRQCLQDCGVGIFPADNSDVVIDEATFRAAEPWPACPGCGGMARPNILMFGDYGWDSDRASDQREQWEAWLDSLRKHQSPKLAIVEIGAGLAIPTIRGLSETLVKIHGARLIRINPREPEVPPRQIGIAAGAFETLRAIDALLSPGSAR